MTERRALVVEVDAATQLGLLGFLRVRGYLCVAVSSAAEAREALADGSFSFTLVDLGLKSLKAPIAALCYGSAIIGSVVAALLLLGIWS